MMLYMHGWVTAPGRWYGVECVGVEFVAGGSVDVESVLVASVGVDFVDMNLNLLRKITQATSMDI